MRTEDFVYMRTAMEMAKEAYDAGEVPVGAVVVCEGKIVGRGRNRVEEISLPTAHAEIEAIEEACKCLKRWRLTGGTLYTTLEPCVMCWGAIRNARISRVVVGARDLKAGALSFYRWKARVPEVSFGVLEEEAERILQNFFKECR